MEIHALENNQISLASVVGLLQPWRDRAVFSYLNRPRPDNGLIYILCREAIYTMPDGESLCAPQGAVIYLPEGSHYHVHFSVAPNTAISTMLINFSIFDETPARIVLGKQPMLLCTDRDGEYESRFRQIIALCYTQNNLLTKALLYDLLHQILQSAPSAPDVKTPDMADILAELDLHLTDIPISVPDMARRFAMSEATFRRRFRTYIGVSPIEYINRRKIERAKVMLSTPEGTVELICEVLHYYDPAYFTKQFRKYTGMTPAAYRNALTRPPAEPADRPI